MTYNVFELKISRRSGLYTDKNEIVHNERDNREDTQERQHTHMLRESANLLNGAFCLYLLNLYTINY